MLYIFDRDEKVVGFLQSNSDRNKNIYYNDVLTEILSSGADSFAFTAISNRDTSKNLTVGNYIAFKKGNKFKLMQIMEVNESRENALTKEIYCESAGLELINTVYSGSKMSTVNIESFLKNVLQDTNWEVGYIDSNLTKTLSLEIEEKEVYSIIQEYLYDFEAEIDFRVEIKGNRIVGRYIDVYSKRGRNNGRRLEINRDIKSISRKVSLTEYATKLIGEGKNGLNFRDISMSGEINKPLGQNFVVNEEAYSRINNKGKHITRKFTYDTEDAYELLRQTYKALKEYSEPKVTYEVDADILNFDDIEIGDYVSISDLSFTPPLLVTARISELETSKTNKYANKAILSNFNEVRSGISSIFPIPGDNIVSGSIGGEQMNPDYVDSIISDSVNTTMIKTEILLANKANIEDLNAANAEIENLKVNKAEITDLNATNANIENLKADKADIADLNATNATIEDLKANKADITELNAINANIDKLTANKAEITELETVKADIGSLTAGKADIGMLDSINANIEILNAGYAKIEDLDVNKADIEDLRATNANIENLKADVADIDKLVSNKADITDLNATNANIDKLVAKDAQIENLVAEKADISQLNATNANIGTLTANLAQVETLVAQKANIGDLNATNANVENLKAGQAEIEVLVASKASIEDLKSTNASIGQLQANKADITELNVAKGEITQLKSEVAEIGTLKGEVADIEHILAGNIGADNIAAGAITSDKIQTGAITAGSGIIANGAIGSAQISSIDAGKISTGTVDTSKVTIQGTNGHLKIKGNRLQVFNGTGNNAKERVSLGDVNGNGSVYGLRVRGADGTTILLDENGVKSEGITDGAITNDKISDNANIDGTKLNINSVVNKINEDGTETIQGTKIEVDGTTLNTKLSTITNKQTEDSNKISQAQSQITANTNAIKLKVDEQTYTADKRDMTSKLEKNTSEITTMKGQIALKVEQTDIENAKSEIEGVIDTKVDSAKAEIKVATDAISQNVSNLSQTVSNKADGSTVTTLSNKVGSLETSVNGISGKVTNLEKTTTTLGGQVSNAQNVADSAVSKANNAQNTANTANSTANANKSNITNLQGEVSTVKSDIASLEVTTSGISQKVSSVESTTASLSTQVTTAQNTANSAQSTANSANSNATNALNKANDANILASSKAKVFTSTPTVPYQVGDLWVQGTNGDVMKCKTARTSGSYTASDWEKASKYTDDTKANAVDGKVTNLQTEYNKTKSQVAEIVTDLDGITQRVSSTESTTTTLTAQVSTAQNTANKAVTDASNAQSTANTANTNATSAINKANTAQSTADNVNNKLEGLKIGGTNLLKGTKDFSTGKGNATVDTTKYYDFTVLKNNVPSTGYADICQWTNLAIKPNTEYTLSFYAKASVNGAKHYSYLYPNAVAVGSNSSGATTNAPDGAIITTLTTEWKRYWVTWKTSSTLSGAKSMIPMRILSSLATTGVTTYICGVQFEEGNKATDWAPAPEDIDDNIADVKNSLSGFQNTVNTTFKDGIIEQAEAKAIAQHLKTLDAEKADIDKEYSAIYSNANLTGSAKTNLASAKTSFDSAHASLKSTINTVISDGRVSSSESASVTSTFNTYNTQLGMYKQRIQEALDAIGSAKVDNLQIGGRNLIRKADVAQNNSTATFNESTKTWTIKASAGAGGTWGCGLVLRNRNILVPYGKSYVLSFEIKVPRNCSWNVDVNNYAITGSSWAGNDNDNIPKRSTSSNSLTANQWIKCWVKWENTNTNNTNKVDLCDNSNFGVVMKDETSDMTYEIRNVQGELGNMPTEYTPAPEDIDGAINSVDSKVDTLRTEYNSTKSKVATLETDLSGITSRVSSAETNIEKISNASSQNLLYNSDFRIVNGGIPDGWSVSDSSKIALDPNSTLLDGIPTFWFNVTGLTENAWKAVFSPFISAKAGEKFVASAYVIGHNNWSVLDNGASLEIEFYNDSSRISTVSTSVNKSNLNWQRLVVKGIAPTGTTKVRIRVHPVKNGQFNMSKPMLQYGETVTGWDRGFDINNLTTRLKTAEQKITDDAITNTVKKNFYTKSETDNQITSKGYQTASEVQQTVNGLQVKVSQSGGYNLIRNSTGASGNTSGWTYSGTSMGVGRNNSIGSSNTTYMYLNNGTTTSERYAFSSRFKLKPNTTYRFTGYFHNYTSCPSFDVFVLASTTLEETDTSTSYDVVHHLINQNTNGSWKKYSITFTTPAGVKSGYLRIDNNGYNSNGTNPNNIHWNSLILTEGELEVPWSPHPSEVYDGITQIDKDGIKINQSNINGYTHMSASGFYVNKSGEDVVKVTNDGVYIKGRVDIVSGSVPTSSLSGTINSNQLNSTITNDISTAKNNASSAITKANNAQSTANTANNTLNSNKDNWSNAYNRVNEWAYGAVTGSTNINGGMIATNTITANKMAIADFTNYCEMNIDNCSTYGFTKTTDSSASNNHWMKLNSLARDTAIVSKKNYDAYKGNVQGTYRISFEFNSTVKGATTSGGTDSVLRPIGVGLYCKDLNGNNAWHIVSCSSFTSGANKTYSGTVTLGSNIVSFGVYVQIEGHAPFTGQLLIRNIKVNKMANGELIVDGAITADKIASRVINADKIASGTITSNEIKAGTITSDKIASRTITADRIATGVLTANEIKTGTITSDRIASRTITADRIAAGVLTANEIAANTITANKIASRTITADRIAAGAITANEIKASTITATQMAANSITADKIAAGAITANKIASGAITATMITSGTLDASKVNVTNLNANNITSGTISGNRIKGGTLSAADEINFVGGARIFGNSGAYDAGLFISAQQHELMHGNVYIGENLNVSKGFKVTGATTLNGTVTCNALNSNGQITAKGLSITGNVGVSNQLNAIKLVTNGIDVYGYTNLDGNVHISGNLGIVGDLTVRNKAIYGMNNIALARGTVYLPQGGGNNTTDYLRIGGGFMAGVDSGNFHFLTRDGGVARIYAGNVSTAYSLEPITKISNHSVFDEINSVNVVDTEEGLRLIDNPVRATSTNETPKAVYTTYNEQTEQEEVNIDYTTAISTLWKAVQELKQEVEMLKNKNEGEL